MRGEAPASVAPALLPKYIVERKASALRLKERSDTGKGRDLRIDVVPGRYVDDQKKGVFLYRSPSRA
jgi:hypothetical protein